MLNTILNCDVLDGLKQLPDESVNCCITSPPYWGLRDYGNDGQIGLEKTPDEYVAKMVQVFSEVKRVLKNDGTLWLNLGDSYSSGGRGSYSSSEQLNGSKQATNRAWNHDINLKQTPRPLMPDGLKPKDLIGIPWSVAFALRADGWYLRQDIIWCLSGGVWIYAKTQKGEMPMMVRDLFRLNPDTVQLWNGEKWTRLLGMNKNARKGDEIEIVLRSGERISCTPTHQWPTNKGLKKASELQIGDTLMSATLPDSEYRFSVLDEDAAWLCGLYLAEGSRSEDCIQIAGHVKESQRLLKLTSIAKKYDGYITHTIDGNNQHIRLYGKILNAIIDTFVSGRIAKDKCFSPYVWKKPNTFIAAMLDGYLSGDGSWDEKNNRWRLGFTRNYNLERDLRTACARLGYSITLNQSFVDHNNSKRPTFRGEIRKNHSGHFNEKSKNEIVEIRKARCRFVYDLGVEDEPHLFSLASGILSHNSKPNPMPESVTDRCTKSHEYIFLMSKSQRYYYDYESVLEEASGRSCGNRTYKYDGVPGMETKQGILSIADKEWDNRNKRSVWTVNTKPLSESHFATFPEKLIEPCIKAGCPEYVMENGLPKKGVVLDPFMGAGTTALVAKKLNRNYIGIELNPDYIKIAEKRIFNEIGLFV